MRTLSALFALSALSATAFAKTSYNGDGYTDVGKDTPPALNTQKWSYWPVSNKREKICQAHLGVC
jgi:hypothetical protein